MTLYSENSKVKKEGSWGPFCLLEIKDQAGVEKLGNNYYNHETCHFKTLISAVYLSVCVYIATHTHHVLFYIGLV